MEVDISIGIGANVGDRVFNIREAIRQLSLSSIHVVSTGFLYQTQPMYLSDQPLFLNTAVKASTVLSPQEVLIQLKAIESRIGRIKTVRNGPRTIDLDLLFYGDRLISDPDLIVPHPRLSERMFVIAPLRDIDPDFLHPVTKLSINQIYTSLERDAMRTLCLQVTPNGLLDGVFELGKKSFIMGILNTTPDSFSDGGRYENIDSAVDHARKMIAQGADIVDVGGESTRPSAKAVDAEEEILRVVEIIKKIRREFPNIPISIDTYKACTAAAAVAAGACIVNDVSGGLLDKDMLTTVAKLGVPYICVHSGRVGDILIEENASFSDLPKSSTDFVVNILNEQIYKRVQDCMHAGIPRWDLVLDPGLGFGKTGSANFTIVKNLEKIFNRQLESFPVLIGASRKRFVRDLQGGSEWKGSTHDAMVGTAAVTVASIASFPSRVAFHRVHDVSELRRAVDIAHMLYRCDGA